MNTFDTNVYDEPGIRKTYIYTGNGCRIQGELRGADLGGGTYRFACHFAFNAAHAPEFVNLKDCILVTH